MRLLYLNDQNEITLTKDLVNNVPPYAILSHTWVADDDEVTFNDLFNGRGRDKAGYKKIWFCGEQALRDGITYFWVDTCCIDKSNYTELSEAITSMFRWYRQAVKCYVYLTDVTSNAAHDESRTLSTWESEFRNSRWFTRGWTLQELLAPDTVEFYTHHGELLGDKKTLIQLIHEITGIPVDALRGTSLSLFPQKERMQWALRRQTTKPEDRAYCLLGIFEAFMPLIYGEGDNAFARLEKCIAEHYGSTIDMAHEHWLVSRPAQPLFTGRKTILKELETIIRESAYAIHPDRQCRIVISGIGGQGKSEMCLQLASRLRHLFWAVLWVDVSTTEIAERSFLEIAQSLSLPAQTWQDARSRIANLSRPFLLVLDNADSLDVDYLEYFPDNPAGVVLMTTRNEECHQYGTAQSVDLGGLNEEDACELLLKACRVPLDQYNQYQTDARNVARLLESHALALLQASAYIARGHCSLRTYPMIYQQQRRRLMNFRPRQAQSRYQDVYTTFEVSADALKMMSTEAAQDALRLLPLLAVWGPTHLPISMLFKAAQQGAKQIPTNPKACSRRKKDENNVSLLTAWHVAQCPPFTSSSYDNYDPYRLTEAVSLLKAFSLLSVDANDSSLFVSLHPLVHAWSWDRQSEDEQHQSWLQCGCLLTLALENGKLTLSEQRQLQVHIEALMQWPAETMFGGELPMSIAQILYRCGFHLHKLRADTKLHTFILKVFTGLKLDLRKVEPEYTDLYQLAGRNFVHCGKAQDSTTILEQVVKIRQEILPEDHPERLMSQHELARAYYTNGEISKAIVLLKETVRVKKQSLAEDHREQLASLHELARAYHKNGQIKEAVALFEDIVRIRDQSAGEDPDPDQLTSWHELARAYLKDGQTKKAIKLFEKVVQIKEQSLPEDHPSRLVSQFSLAVSFLESGERQKALPIIRHVVAISQRIYNEDHPRRQLYERRLTRLEDRRADSKKVVFV